MDRVFKALADATRRDLLDKLRIESGQTLSELAANVAMSRQAVSRHLQVLEEANLVSSVWRGREKFHYLNPIPIAEIFERWVGRFERDRTKALLILKRALEDRDDD